MADAALAAADRSQVLPLYSAAKRGACCGLDGVERNERNGDQ